MGANENNVAYVIIIIIKSIEHKSVSGKAILRAHACIQAMYKQLTTDDEEGITAGKHSTLSAV